MPLVILVFAVIFIVVGLNGCHSSLFEQVKNDFTGQNNFFMWIAAIAMVGAVGYIPKMKPISNAFLVLILLSLTLTHRGIFDPNNGFVGQIKSASA